MTVTRTFARQEIDPNGDIVALTNRTAVHLIPGKCVVLKEGTRITAYYDRWKDSDKLEYIRSEFIRILQNPRTAAPADWTVLAA